MNYKNSDIVYTIISEIGEYEMRARPVFATKQLALEYAKENDLRDADFELCTLYYECSDEREGEEEDEKEAEN